MNNTGKALTVEEIEAMLNERLQGVFNTFKNTKLDQATKERFRAEMAHVLTTFSQDIGYDENPMKYIEVVVATDEAHPSMLLVNFEPLDPKLRSPQIVRHVSTHLKEDKEYRAPIYSASVGLGMAISGWGPTPIHAVAELQRNHGAN